MRSLGGRLEPSLGTLNASAQSLGFILGQRGLTKERVNLTGLCFRKMSGEKVEALCRTVQKAFDKDMNYVRSSKGGINGRNVRAISKMVSSGAWQQIVSGAREREEPKINWRF